MIEHQAEQSRFVLLKDGHECVLDYLVTGKDINFTHTYVPLPCADKAWRSFWSRKVWPGPRHSYTLHASCSYVQRFL